MSQAVLIMNMPETCKDCRFDLEGFSGDWPVKLCELTEETIQNENESRAEGCPLHRLPDKKNLLDDTTDDITWVYHFGFNTCLDEIIGGSDE